MPIKSKAQRAYLHIHEPEVAAEFEAATPKDAKLPERTKKKRRNKKSTQPAEAKERFYV
jgi:hypothetical protein